MRYRLGIIGYRRICSQIMMKKHFGMKLIK
nr:MAG TPA: hypothetical protein [Caudoviricetes sp.]